MKQTDSYQNVTPINYFAKDCDEEQRIEARASEILDELHETYAVEVGGKSFGLLTFLMAYGGENAISTAESIILNDEISTRQDMNRELYTAAKELARLEK